VSYPAAMRLEGSCHCGAVRFSLESHEFVPYMRCYCSICRKTSGGGGWLVNLGGDARTLEVEGREHVRTYQAMIERAGKRVKSRHQRHFCGECGTHLWAFNDRWPELVHPVASAIDTPLPVPAERVHIMLGSKAPWVEVEGQEGDPHFDEYPEESLADWHRRHGFAGA
jgi:hypothetical protein